jgi:hypothetical protein
MMRTSLIILGLLTLVAGNAAAQTGFFSFDTSLMKAQQTGEGQDLVYTGAGGTDRLANYNAIMVDQPEVHFAADSKYRGMKPEDSAALAGILRDNMTTELKKGGYAVVDQPGPQVLFLRMALVDLYIKKDKRGLLSYTPVGIVVHAGADALTDTLKKIDIIEMSVAAEVVDSRSGDVIGAVLLKRGHKKEHGQKETRMEVDELVALAQEYSQRFHCRLDNAKKPEAQRINCDDAAARKAAGM